MKKRPRFLCSKGENGDNMENFDLKASGDDQIWWGNFQPEGKSIIQNKGKRSAEVQESPDTITGQLIRLPGRMRFPTTLKRSLIFLIFCVGIVGFLRCKKATNTPEPEKIPFVIENLGVTFGPWDKKTNLAGDFFFTNDFVKIFGEFGGQTRDPEGNIKELPHFDYVLKKDAIVFAISEGTVTRVVYQNESNDYEFSITSQHDPSYDVVYDHLVNLRIKLGDKIAPGDSLGNPRPWTLQVGGLEIMVNNYDTRLSYCPFVYFNEAKLEEFQRKISQLMDDWEEFKGDTTIFDQENYVFPGCRYESMANY
ncbi:peptidoglycan DD-metalloendopeptidase family protein [candidate division KSB1 bacterium]|nr:peptidoglycan DD-metalloendopeptidase family protein [candidate division KSB1 bacterium]